MSLKIYTSGNYLYLEDTESGKIYTGLTKDVIVAPANSAKEETTHYFIHNVIGWSNTRAVEIEDIQDAGGNSLDNTTFKAFYEEELGKSSAGGSASTTNFVVSQEQYDSYSDAEKEGKTFDIV